MNLRSTRPASSFSAAARKGRLILAATLLIGCESALAPPASAPPPAAVETRSQAATLTGFTDQVVFSGMTNPIAVRFAADGRVFVAEENGRIVFFDSLSDTSFTVFADLDSVVNSYWDRGLLGFTLDPDFATNGRMYVLYTHDTATNSEDGTSVANRNGSDTCPSPPGGTSQGCVTYGRLSSLTDTGGPYPITARVDLITEWPQQFPSHAIGGLAFGPDGNLYATGGDGASFNTTDYGQFGIPKNPLGDPPGGVGATLSSPTSRGGALRSQSFRRPSGENVVLNGTIIRVDPTNGAPASGNPNSGHSDIDARRLIAFGLRNPYRFAFHPTTGDIWIGDVGGNAWEEINRLPAPLTATPLKNFGWPCYEGSPRNGGWDSLNMNLCESFYSGGGHTAPYYAYQHGQPVYSGDDCATGGAAITGIAFYPEVGGNYPTGYRNAMFFSDLPRDCIWVMTPGTNGLPSVASRTNFVVNAANPVDLVIGPNNDLFYVDYGGGGGTGTNAGQGKVHRIRYQAPTAIATANPTSGFTPLAVQFTGSQSTPGIPGDTLSYAWDLDGDGQYDDSTATNPSRTYTSPATIDVRLRVTDQRGGVGESAPITIVAGSTVSPPTPVIDTPLSSLTWKVGDGISFSGHATDEEDGTIPASGLTWDVVMIHCPIECHEHLVQSFEGVASGSFPAPDHEYPSYLQLRLTATDSHGVTSTVVRDLQPQTVNLTFQTTPTASPGLELGFNLESAVTPFTRTVILGSFNSVAAPNQTRGSTLYTWDSWSDGGAQNHDFTANAAATYTATYTTSVTPWVSQDIGATGATGTWIESNGVHTIEGAGADIWNAADQFRFTYQQVTGDATITARVTELEQTHDFSKAGVMFRQSLADDSVNVHNLVSPIPTSKFRYIKRLTTGATSSAEVGPDSPLPDNPGWVRVVREGNVFTAYTSLDGSSWAQIGTPQTIAMGSTVYVGMAVTSHVAGTLATAKFDNLTITTPAPPGPPGAPTGLSATGGDGQVSLSWNAVSGATSYNVKWATQSGGPYATISGITGTSYTHTGRTNGTTYYYVVSAQNSSGESGNTAQVSATPNAPPPSTWTGGDVGAVAANGSYSESSGTFTVNGSGADIWSTADGFHFVRQSLTGDGTITARVVSVENTHAFAKAGVMVRESLTAGSRNLFAILTPTDANGYRYQYRTSTGAITDRTFVTPGQPPGWLRIVRAGNVFTGQYSTNGTTWNDIGPAVTMALPSTVYVGLAVTSHADGVLATGVFDNVSVTTPTPPSPPPAPTGLSATAGTGQVALAWSASSGATGYKVLRSTTSGSGYSQIAQVGGTSHIDTTGTYGTTYYYVVRASNAAGDSGNSNEASAAPIAPPPPPVPTGLTATAGNNQVALDWANSSGATSYNVKRATGSGGPYTTIASVGSSAHTDTTAVNGTTYFYVVSALNANGESNNSTEASATPQAPPPPPAPTNLQATAGDGQVALSWSASAGATTYTVKRSTTPGTGYQVVQAGITGTSFTNTGLVNFTTYYYVVSATNANGESDDSTEASATPVPPPAPPAPTNLQATAGDTTVSLTWNASAGATSYSVLRSTTSGSGYTLVQGGITQTAFTDTGLSNGTTYYYVVSATNSGGTSGTSSQVSATPEEPSVVEIYLEAEAGTLTAPLVVQSDATASGGSYITASGTGNSTAAPPADGHATYSFTAPVAGTYWVWGRALSPSTSADSFWVRIDTGTWVKWNEIPISTVWAWDDVHDNDAGNAVVQFPLSAGPHTLEIAYRERPTQLDRIFITNDPGALPSDPPPPPPQAPAGLSATAGNGQVTLTWNVSVGATAYTVKRSTTSGGSYTDVQTGITATSFTNTGLSNGTTYYYVVTATNASGTSGNSNEASATPVAGPTWSNQDIGAVAASGSFSQSGGTYTVNASGADIWNAADEFHFVYQSLTGDGTITARVTSVQNTNVWAKAGVMMRESTATGARNVFSLVSATASNGYRWQRRETAGGSSASTKVGTGAIPVWLRVTRVGNVFTGYQSSNGTSWTQIGTTTIAMPSTILVGLAATSHADGTVGTSVFDNVSVSP